MPDHIHMCLSIPPKYSVANTVDFLKGKSAVRIPPALPEAPHFACRLPVSNWPSNSAVVSLRSRSAAR
jgi:REP element-mobilizing transposase RayT